MTRTVKVGNLFIGGGNPITVQSMTTTRTKDISATEKQIRKLIEVGADIVRVAVSDKEDTEAIKVLKQALNVPIVADIQFDYRLAILSVENGADKIRINPGNIGGEEKLKEVAAVVKEYGIPVRVGSNSGSIEKEFFDKYGNSVKALSESTLKSAAALERCGVDNIVLAAKASDVRLMVETNRYLSKVCDYPLHLGVTEAGTKENGTVKSAMGIGALLLDGIGDTIRVSLSDNPIEEVYAAKRILCGLNLLPHVEVVACPTCGRCEYDCIGLAAEIQKVVQNIHKSYKIAVMGCVVNGPGEARDCDLGIAGSKEKCVIFKKGKIFRTIDSGDAKEEFVKEIQKLICRVQN